jgi:hypothetical protein
MLISFRLKILGQKEPVSAINYRIGSDHPIAEILPYGVQITTRVVWNDKVTVIIIPWHQIEEFSYEVQGGEPSN